MGEDTNIGPTGEQPTAVDIDQGALAQLRRQLGELTGGELDLTDVQVINLITAVGARTDSDGSVTYRHILLPRKFCNGARLMDVTGQAVTAGNGVVTFLLSSFICATRLSVLPPVNLVATPFSTQPVSATTQYKLVPRPGRPRGVHRPRDHPDGLVAGRLTGAGGSARLALPRGRGRHHPLNQHAVCG